MQPSLYASMQPVDQLILCSVPQRMYPCMYFCILNSGVDSKTRVGVLLIDVGGVQVVDVSHLQFLEPKFASAPCISLPCHLRQIGPSREPMECSTTDESQTEVTYSWHQFNKSLRDVVEKINSSENSSSIKWFSEFYQHHNFDEVISGMPRCRDAEMPRCLISISFTFP